MTINSYFLIIETTFIIIDNIIAYEFLLILTFDDILNFDTIKITRT